MNLFLSIETWDIDDTLLLLFLLHYHRKGRINLLGVEIDRGTRLQNTYVEYILKIAEEDIPLFSRNLESQENEIPEYYYTFFEGLERKEIILPPREETLELLEGKEFTLIVGGSLNFAVFLLKKGIIPKEIFFQGGFAGFNITRRVNKKFGKKVFTPTFNLNKDIKASDEFFLLRQELDIPTYMVSKNVNHLILVKEEDIPDISPSTKPQEIYINILKKYLKNVRREKSLHDVYTAVAFFNRELFAWKEISPIFRQGKRFREWGSEEKAGSLRITVDAKEEEVKAYSLFKKEF
ncbi:nucleoside hydrolase [Aquifex pyrophilus]